MNEYIEVNKKSWATIAEHHYKAFKKQLSQYKSILNKTQIKELGDISGKKLIHHFDLEYEYCIMDLPNINLLSCPAFLDSYHKHIVSDCEYYRLQYYKICKLISWISSFAEALQKAGNTILETRYRNTQKWLRNTLRQCKC